MVIHALHKNAATFHPVVPFNKQEDKLLPLDLSEANQKLTPEIFGDLPAFTRFIEHEIKAHHCKYAIGGYGEQRSIYAASSHFDGGDEPRRFHLGIDIWGKAGTPVFAFMGGRVHSFAYNHARGDYGATLVLIHQLEGYSFHSLYGHIALKDIQQLTDSQYVSRGQEIAHFGEPHENGGWPPHLHFQLIIDMELKRGDYPGVCKYSERKKYLHNCPDPQLVLQM